ncbi:putative mitochondrial protein [Andalucia godoyi]|uniref:Putative mitochondrial protein n=1 Tax=Andalucia godoyi TaxID=505711 RepID=A0A8K0F276_ANDGO|nr:putative mitochondrial protein [Andalucia godoyi]|eukprot:ANDGO_03665.mRNA.1 putative mitochondrial protein
MQSSTLTPKSFTAHRQARQAGTVRLSGLDSPSSSSPSFSNDISSPSGHSAAVSPSPSSSSLRPGSGSIRTHKSPSHLTSLYGPSSSSPEMPPLSPYAGGSLSISASPKSAALHMVSTPSANTQSIALRRKGGQPVRFLTPLSPVSGSGSSDSLVAPPKSPTSSSASPSSQSCTSPGGYKNLKPISSPSNRTVSPNSFSASKNTAFSSSNNNSNIDHNSSSMYVNAPPKSPFGLSAHCGLANLDLKERPFKAVDSQHNSLSVSTPKLSVQQPSRKNLLAVQKVAIHVRNATGFPIRFNVYFIKGTYSPPNSQHAGDANFHNFSENLDEAEFMVWPAQVVSKTINASQVLVAIATQAWNRCVLVGPMTAHTFKVSLSVRKDDEGLTWKMADSNRINVDPVVFHSFHHAGRDTLVWEPSDFDNQDAEKIVSFRSIRKREVGAVLYDQHAK